MVSKGVLREDVGTSYAFPHLSLVFDVSVHSWAVSGGPVWSCLSRLRQTSTVSLTLNFHI